MTGPTGLLEVAVAILLLASGLLSLIAALGLLRLRDFFQRMHAPALTTTLGTWCAALASILDFSAIRAHPDLRDVLIVMLLALSAPVTTTLLARATLFRQRAALSERRERSEAAAIASTAARAADEG